jgi:sugar lactone lactonase YvrE
MRLRNTVCSFLQAVLVTFLWQACSENFVIPDEPENPGIPIGEIAYVVQYEWVDVPAFQDLALIGGILFAIQGDSLVSAWLSDAAEGRQNDRFNLPFPVVHDGKAYSSPVHLCAGPANTIWVAYQDPPTVLQFDLGSSPPAPSGLLVRLRSDSDIGGITADLDSGFVYVADATANAITKYSADDAGGVAIRIIAEPGNGDGFVREPRGIFWFDDKLLVADTGKSWLQLLDADTPLLGQGQITGPEDDPLQLRDARDVWVDAAGYYYVADTANNRILQINEEGIVREEVTELDPVSALSPISVVANRTQVWVPNADEHRLTIYQINTAGEDLP